MAGRTAPDQEPSVSVWRGAQQAATSHHPHSPRPEAPMAPYSLVSARRAPRPRLTRTAAPRTTHPSQGAPPAALPGAGRGRIREPGVPAFPAGTGITGRGRRGGRCATCRPVPGRGRCATSRTNAPGSRAAGRRRHSDSPGRSSAHGERSHRNPLAPAARPCVTARPGSKPGRRVPAGAPLGLRSFLQGLVGVPAGRAGPGPPSSCAGTSRSSVSRSEGEAGPRPPPSAVRAHPYESPSRSVCGRRGWGPGRP